MDPSQYQHREHSRHSGDEPVDHLESESNDEIRESAVTRQKRPYYRVDSGDDNDDIHGYGKRENREDRVIEWPPKGFQREDSLSHSEAEELVSWGSPIFRGMEYSCHFLRRYFEWP